MAFKDRKAFHQGINNYVPGMQYADEMIGAIPTPFSLGTPALGVINALHAGVTSNAVATTETSIVLLPNGADSPYGRTVNMQAAADPGNAAVYDMYGWDYLGQPMIERFTHINGSTAIIYGKKAFYRYNKVKVVTASSNATTIKVGTGARLGLPYKGDVAWAKEGNVLAPLFKRDFILYADRGAADAAAGISKWFRAPCPGFIKTLIGTPDGGGSTNDPVIIAKLATVAITGLTVTIDTSDTAGLTVTDTPTTAGYNANNRFVANGLIEVVGAAAASAKGDRLGLEITPTQFSLPDLTDPATVSTLDPRGTYEAISALDGVIEVVAALVGDNAVNSSNNGGLHGIKHYYA